MILVGLGECFPDDIRDTRTFKNIVPTWLATGNPLDCIIRRGHTDGGFNFSSWSHAEYDAIADKLKVALDADVRAKLAKQAADLALLSQNMLTGEELTKFIKRSLNFIK